MPPLKSFIFPLTVQSNKMLFDMEENKQGTIDDKEVWRKAESVNKAKFLALMGSSTTTVWVLAIIAVAIVGLLLVILPSADPVIKSASQSGQKIAVLTESKVYLADKSTGSVTTIDTNVNSMAIAAGTDLVAIVNRPENKIMLFGWDAKPAGEIQIDSPSACCFGSDWLYVLSKSSILVLKDNERINTMPAPGDLKVARAMFEHEAVWIADAGGLWKSGQNGWTSVPVEVDEDYRSAWVGKTITTMHPKFIRTCDLDGKNPSDIEFPKWYATNSWICEDLIVIDNWKILVGNPSDLEPTVFEIR
jgi:hypothetical protein